MITIEVARQIADTHLRDTSRDGGMNLVIVDEETLEYEFGWVFFYNSRAYLETGSYREMLAGNAPLIVDRRDGSVHVTGTAYPIDYYVENYMKYGSPYANQCDA